MARKAVEQELTRERILEVARDLFATKGYRAVSMRSIGQELGYSHGSLYYHFKDKAELFYAIVVEDFTTLDQRLSDILKQPPSEGFSTLEKVMLEFIRFGLESRHHYEIMFLISDPELQRYSRPEQTQLFSHFSSVVSEAANHELPSFASYAKLPLSLFFSLHGFITHYIHSNKSFMEISDEAREHVRFLCRGLC